MEGASPFSDGGESNASKKPLPKLTLRGPKRQGGAEGTNADSKGAQIGSGEANAIQQDGNEKAQRNGVSVGHEHARERSGATANAASGIGGEQRHPAATIMPRPETTAHSRADAEPPGGASGEGSAQPNDKPKRLNIFLSGKPDDGGAKPWEASSRRGFGSGKNAGKAGQVHGIARYKTPDCKLGEPIERQYVWKHCKALIDRLRKDRSNFHWFKEPVDTTRYPNYTLFVQHPMDFGTISQRLKEGYYNEPQEFLDDVNLVFRNCEKFNTAESAVGQAALTLEIKFDQEWHRRSMEQLIHDAGWKIERRPEPRALPQPSKQSNKGGDQQNSKKRGKSPPGSPHAGDLDDLELEKENPVFQQPKPTSKKKKSDAQPTSRPARSGGKRPRLPDGEVSPEEKKEERQAKQGKGHKKAVDAERGLEEPGKAEGEGKGNTNRQSDSHGGDKSPQPGQRAEDDGTDPRDLPPGVRYGKHGKWIAEYRRGSQPRKWLGSFPTKEEAIQAYEQEEKERGHQSWRLQGPGLSGGLMSKQMGRGMAPPPAPSVTRTDRQAVYSALLNLSENSLQSLLGIIQADPNHPDMSDQEEVQLDVYSLSDGTLIRIMSYLDQEYPKWRSIHASATPANPAPAGFGAFGNEGEDEVSSSSSSSSSSEGEGTGASPAPTAGQEGQSTPAPGAHFATEASGSGERLGGPQFVAPHSSEAVTQRGGPSNESAWQNLAETTSPAGVTGTGATGGEQGTGARDDGDNSSSSDSSDSE